MNLSKVFFCLGTFLGKWRQAQETNLATYNLSLITEEGFCSYYHWNYFEAKFFNSISSLFIATTVINTDINFQKAWTFLMDINISNKEYNFFIISEPAMWQFFLCCLSRIHSSHLEFTWLSYSKASSYRAKVKEGRCMKYLYLHNI